MRDNLPRAFKNLKSRIDVGVKREMIFELGMNVPRLMCRACVRNLSAAHFGVV